MNHNPRTTMRRHPAHRRNLFLLAISSVLFILAGLRTSARAECGGNSSQNAPTNSGTEFLICFEQNIDNSPTIDVPNGGGYLEIYVATLSDSATVTFTSRRYPTLDKVVTLPGHSSYIYRISDSTVQAGLGITDTMNDLWMTSTETPDNRVVMVQSSANVVCYAMDYRYESADAVCALPANDAGTDYRVMSFQNSVDASDGPNMPSEFAVAAFVDSTVVTITPACATAGGHAAGLPFTIVLQKGQGVQVQTDGTVPGLDLTGSQISANHPIVVYGGHSRTEIPHNWERSGPGGGFASRDNLLEAMPPTSDWGTAFVLDAIANDNAGNFGPDGDLVRVLALNANTSVMVNGQPWTTLGANQFADTMIHGPMMIQSTSGVLVGEYMHSQYSTNGDGDPFLAIVPPVSQTFNDYTFMVPSNQAFSIQYVVIATDVTSQGSISLDGTTLPSAAFTAVPGAIGNQHFSILEDNLSGSQTVHTISTMMPAGNGFTILGYGLGDVVSYGYTAGSLLVPQRTIGIDPPPQAMGGQHGNWLDFRNTSFQPAYLDSAVFTANDGSNYGIHTQENIAYDIGTLNVGQGARIHLVSTAPLQEPVRGTVKIYAHTPDYVGLEPGSIPFTLYPDASSSVTPNAAGTLAVTAYASPNPFEGFTNLHFSIPSSGDVTLTLYDELGRVVQHVSSGDLSSGAYSVRLERRGLAAGIYTCEIVSHKLNIDERVPIVAGE